ncbi:VOC family protein [Winogradskyella sp. UBA3174]|uniref:VOC family protein n=1 Tax=Winogradskyella sp. UBA3174 TaxID=1947785 RepID=UPI0025EC0D24|nr:VOC family protein [Winogradskyella sp. UBA3174]|tara:strand:+ start:96420 stop:96797 length:378 start_codon:yes stop_codon:yes gene_type:complete
MNLNQVTISSLDVTKSTAFYKTLGLNLIVDALPRYVRFECPDGDSTFSIHSIDKLPEGNKITLYFEVDNLSKTVSELKQKGITFNTEIKEQSWLWTDIDLNDPDGHKIIIFHAGKNRKNPPWRIN